MIAVVVNFILLYLLRACIFQKFSNSFFIGQATAEAEAFQSKHF